MAQVKIDLIDNGSAWLPIASHILLMNLSFLSTNVPLERSTGIFATFSHTFISY